MFPITLIDIRPLASVAASGRPPVRSRRAQGFTLTELLVVIGIAVLLLGIGTLGYEQLTRTETVSGAENQIEALLSTVQEEAKKLRTERGLVIYRDEDGRLVMRRIVQVDSGGRSRVFDFEDQRQQLARPGVSARFPTDRELTEVRDVGVFVFNPNGTIGKLPVEIAVGTELAEVLGYSVDTVVQVNQRGYVFRGSELSESLTAEEQAVWCRDNARDFRVDRYAATPYPAI